MKRFITLLLLCVVAMLSYSQTKVIGTTSGNLTAGEYVYLWGSSSDTLTNADTLIFTVRFRGAQTFDVNSQMKIDHVSGTAAYKLYTYNSIDGVNWSAKTSDSLTIASITTDQLYGTALNFSDVITVYKKFQLIQSGTAKTVPKLYFVTRSN